MDDWNNNNNKMESGYKANDNDNNEDNTVDDDWSKGIEVDDVLFDNSKMILRLNMESKTEAMFT